ncbi:phosphoglycolate phosphatase [Nitzschia inconspicua]|uniref:Phosphoglycolate phosphatase n=1 Tax=Nitzschia inconspicua TaxID=303405 RepID=A0A9K3PEV4_9STRA|nr:phosphoglycolate phosphatase [Nitzschia inconspicua]
MKRRKPTVAIASATVTAIVWAKILLQAVTEVPLAVDALFLLPTLFSRQNVLAANTRRRMTASSSSNHDNWSSHNNNNNDGLVQNQSQRTVSTATSFPLPTSLEAIIFDIDGTLADSWKLGYDATLVVLQNHSIPLISPETYHEGTKYSTPHRLARHAGLDPNNDDDTFVRIGTQLAQEFDDLYVGLVTTETAGFFSGMEQVLERILQHPEGIKLGALTNACVDYAHAVLKANSNTQSSPSSLLSLLSLHSQFLSIHGADTVPSPKPDPDGLLLVCKELGVKPEHAVYIGDSPSDASAALNAGMASIGVTWGSHSTESLQQATFTVLCSTPKELCTILKL